MAKMKMKIRSPKRSASVLECHPPEACWQQRTREVSRVSLVVFVGCILIYTLSLPSGITGGDAGELAAVACSKFGVAHPSGYPLHTLLYGFVSKLLPDAFSLSTAFSLLSTLFSAASAALLAQTIAFVSGDASAAATAAFSFAFSPTVWLYAAQAEVFALNNFLLALLLYLTFVTFETESKRLLCLSAFCCSVALCNQHTALLYCVPVAVSFLLQRRHELSKRFLSQLVVAFLLGLAPYAWLPLASSQNGKYSWGDIRSVRGSTQIFLMIFNATFYNLN